MPVKYIFLLLCLLCCTVQPACAAPTPEQWRQLTNDKAFGYRHDKEETLQPPENKPSVFTNLLSQLFSFLGSGIGNVLLWALVIGAVLYIAYQLLLSRGSILFGRHSKKMMDEGPPGQPEEDLASTKWEQLLQQALAANDTRLAIRYTYMWLLQLLQERDLIRYRNDKTNYEYYAELADPRYKQPFRQLSRQYEYAWYGQYPFSPEAYREYANLFNNLRNQLGR